MFFLRSKEGLRALKRAVDGILKWGSGERFGLVYELLKKFPPRGEIRLDISKADRESRDGETVVSKKRKRKGDSKEEVRQRKRR